MNEFELIRRFFARAPKRALAGIGDDCARLRVGQGMELSVTTDMLVEGRHFAAGADPRRLGHKALAVNLSDLAAGGASPRWAMLALALPAAEEGWLQQFSTGFFELAERHGVELIGGDTTRGPLTTISITAMGEVPAGQALHRAGARPGEDLWVSGKLGGAALGLLRPDLPGAARRLHEPQPRVALGERLRGLASAAIDLSDGLAGDLAHILERSSVGALVHYASIPKDESFAGLGDPAIEARCVLSGGDDYELLFTARAGAREAIASLADALELPLTRIGAIEAGAALRIIDQAGREIPVAGAFDHFAAAPQT